MYNTVIEAQINTISVFQICYSVFVTKFYFIVVSYYLLPHSIMTQNKNSLDICRQTVYNPNFN